MTRGQSILGLSDRGEGVTRYGGYSIWGLLDMGVTETYDTVRKRELQRPENEQITSLSVVDTHSRPVHGRCLEYDKTKIY